MLKALLALLAPVGQEQGQVLIMGVGIVVIGLGAIMISLDIGWWLRDKGDLQNDADAIALAAAAELPDESLAELSGLDAADANVVDASQVTFDFFDGDGDGRKEAHVQVSRKSNSFLASAFGVPDPQLTVRAVAGDLTVNAACLRPWAIVAGSPDPFQLAQDPYLFKELPSNADEFGPLSWYGHGSAYEQTLTEACSLSPRNDGCKQSDKVIEENTALTRCYRPHGILDETLHALNDDLYPNPGTCRALTYDEALQNSRTAQCADRAVLIGIVSDADGDGNAFTRDPSDSGSADTPDVIVDGIATFYVADFAEHEDDCDDPAEPPCVEGYLLPHVQSLPQWVVGWSGQGSLSANPFTPVGLALLE